VVDATGHACPYVSCFAFLTLCTASSSPIVTRCVYKSIVLYLAYGTFHRDFHDTMWIGYGPVVTKLSVANGPALILAGPLRSRNESSCSGAPNYNTSIPPHSRTRNKLFAFAFSTSTPTTETQYEGSLAVFLKGPFVHWSSTDD